jgi:hypothetical protein
MTMVVMVLLVLLRLLFLLTMMSGGDDLDHDADGVVAYDD